MDAFDPQNELIDKYLRGELHGHELDSFMRNLNNDPALSRDVEFRKLLVGGIQEYGAVKLKKYLREKTTRQKGLIIGFKTWYYAAAAVGLVLLASVVVFISIQNSNTTKNHTAKFNDTNSGNGNISALEKTEKQTGSISVPQQNISKDTNDSGSEKNDNPDLQNGQDLSISTASDAGAMIMASNISVIPIKIIPATSDNGGGAMGKNPPPIPEPIKKNNKANSKDTAFDFDKTKIANNLEPTFKPIDRFKLNFYSTMDMVPQVKMTDKGDGNTELLVYNLPFDNPIVFAFKEKYYLKTGDKYYELDRNKSGMQKVTAVTDSAVLKALNQ